MNASHVSRIIRKGGVAVRPSGSARSLRGVRVSAASFGEVCVDVDFEIEAIAIRRTAMVREVLEDAGYEVQASRTVPTILYVSRKDGSK